MIKRLGRTYDKNVALTPIITACCSCLGAVVGTKETPADKIAFIDVARIMNESAHGREGQRIMDELRERLDAEFDDYAESGADAAKICERRMALDRVCAYRYTTLVSVIVDHLWTVAEYWLVDHRDNFAAIVSKEHALAADAASDATDEILALFEEEEIDLEAQ